MKMLLLLLLPALLLTACDVGKLTGPPPTPVPTPRVATPAPTPKPGEWMWKDRGNPLEKKPGK